MLQPEEAKKQLREVRGKIIQSVVIDGFAPVVVYLLLRPLLANDTAALALSGVIPVARILIVWFRRHRIDWIGLLAVASIVTALILSYLSGGSALPLELRNTVILAIVGVIFLVSVFIRKPVLPILLQVFSRGDPALATALEKGRDNLINQRRLTMITAVVGTALLGKALADTILALTLPTATFLALSHIVNWVILGSGLVVLWLTRQHDPSQTHS